jgi:hypothetical protein
MPRSIGGTNEKSNIVMACISCNRKKNNYPFYTVAEVLDFFKYRKINYTLECFNAYKKWSALREVNKDRIKK